MPVRSRHPILSLCKYWMTGIEEFRFLYNSYEDKADIPQNIRLDEYKVYNDIVAGDVNGDGFVDVGDVVTLANFVMGDPVDPFYRSAADLNDDKQIDVGDVVALAQMVMGEDTSSD